MKIIGLDFFIICEKTVLLKYYYTVKIGQVFILPTNMMELLFHSYSGNLGWVELPIDALINFQRRKMMTHSIADTKEKHSIFI